MINESKKKTTTKNNLEVDEYKKHNTSNFLGHIKNSPAGNIDISKHFHWEKKEKKERKCAQINYLMIQIWFLLQWFPIHFCPLV